MAGGGCEDVAGGEGEHPGALSAPQTGSRKSAEGSGPYDYERRSLLYSPGLIPAIRRHSRVR
jgi:hypothetical protein